MSGDDMSHDDIGAQIQECLTNMAYSMVEDGCGDPDVLDLTGDWRRKVAEHGLQRIEEYWRLQEEGDEWKNQ
jgi:hypothetical protein